MPTFLPFLKGVFFGFSLIVAIGPQNTYVLRQGLAKRHVATVVSVCVLSDITLIALGAAGTGRIIGTQPLIIELVRFIGATFLTTYAAFALRRAMQTQEPLISMTEVRCSLSRSISTCLAFTWLNPHVYLDTVVLLGMVAGSQGSNSVWFASGSMLASTVWFTALGFGARLLRPLFSHQNASRVLDMVIAIVMFSIGFSLFHQGLNS